MDSRTTDRWARVKAVFSDALERSPAERTAFLAEACADDESIRSEVEALLDSDRLAGSFIETPAVDLLKQPTPDTSQHSELEPGSFLGPYEIVGFLGAGGMSQVYRARDSRLDRIVAIKVVGGAAADPRGEHRLLREAKHASSLAHPYICTIHEVDEAGGRPFIVMEHVEGRPLRDLIREGRLTLADQLRIGAQIADALDHAHQRGVIHRDLKSANVVVVPEGPAKVLDFGLSARLPDASLAQASTSAIMETATVGGTLSHMAPEILLGRRPDPKGDIWALGVLLYEIASGDLPFKGDTAFETGSAILNADPDPLPSHVPLTLRLVIQRCLEKDPARRYQRASDVRAALEAVQRREWLRLTMGLLLARYRRRLALGATAAATGVLVVVAMTQRHEPTSSTIAPIGTLAVLPLTNSSQDPSQDYFADGITESLIGAMGSLDGVRVLSRTTVMKYRRSPNLPEVIGRELGVNAVLSGSIQREGERLRLRVRFVTSGGRILWSHDYDRSLRDARAVENEIVRGVAASGGMRMTDVARARLSTARAVATDVYEAFLQGRYYWNQRSEPSIKTAIRYFEKAIALDPTYALPYAAVADCYNQLATVQFSTGSPQEWRPRARAAAIKALQIDPELAEAHATLGYTRHYDWQWKDAEKDFKRAIELNPSYALAHVWYANLLGSQRRFDQALREVQFARDLDPLSLIVNTNVGWVMNMARRYNESVVQLRHTLELDPQYEQAHRRLVAAYAGLGRHDEALREAQTVARLGDNSPASRGGLAEEFAAVGRTAEARHILNELLVRAKTRYVSPGVFAKLYFALGERDEAFRWVEQAVRERSNFAVYIAVDDSFDAVRSEHRYLELLRRVGLE
jgi:eukaryotic-like serine/threonine-protein kinase